MKKLFVFALLVTGVAGTSFAQDKMEGKKTGTKEAAAEKKEAKGKPAKAAKKDAKADKKDVKGK